jgi:hypothetical protein
MEHISDTTSERQYTFGNPFSGETILQPFLNRRYFWKNFWKEYNFRNPFSSEGFSESIS